MFKSIGKRIMGALNGIATRGEVQAIDSKLNEIAKLQGHKADLIVQDEATENESIQRVARQKQRSTRNRKFHAKRGGALQYGTVAHDMASNKTFQFMYNPLLTSLLYRSGAMGVDYKDSSKSQQTLVG